MAARSPLFLRDQELDRGLALLFFAARELEAETATLLAERGLGRAHHAVLHFSARGEGASVAELQGVLRTSKQTLSRHVRQLVDAGLLTQRPGERDRRQRRLVPTEGGRRLVERLDALQRRRLAEAFRAAGPEAVAGFERVLLGLVDPAALARLRAEA